MDEMRLRGYVSPEDFTGDDTEKIQKALDVSAEKKIGRVVLTGKHTVSKSLMVWEDTEIVLEDAELRAGGDFPLLVNRGLVEPEKYGWAVEDTAIFLTGKNAALYGDVCFGNAYRVVAEDVKFFGALRFSYVHEVRLARDSFEGKNAVVLGAGCNNYIMQELTAKCSGEAVVLDTNVSDMEAVRGKESEIHEIILQDSKLDAPTGIALRAGEKNGIFNVQIDHIESTGDTIRVGDKAAQVSPERYFNFTMIDLASRQGKTIVLDNEVKHAYFGK